MSSPREFLRFEEILAKLIAADLPLQHAATLHAVACRAFFPCSAGMHGLRRWTSLSRGPWWRSPGHRWAAGPDTTSTPGGAAGDSPRSSACGVCSPSCSCRCAHFDLAQEASIAAQVRKRPLSKLRLPNKLHSEVPTTLTKSDLIPD